uniref:Pre-mRNA-processing factor 19 n=2 Tax=Meloidogyne TaxID=189290 RepID=A0A915P8E1_9BILA
MATLLCSICGQQPEVPVVSPASGKIFEKRLIVKYIEENGTDPVTGGKLEISQQLQDEWDATMLNNFTLRQELKSVREELTHALFQNDAACRVINRLSSELQQTRHIIATLPHGRGKNVESEVEVTDVEMHQEGEGLPGIDADLIEFFTLKSQEFSSSRKQRGKNLPEDLASVEDVKRYEEIKCHDALHSASVPGITALDLQQHMILTGGIDKTVVLFNSQTETVENVFKGNQKRVNAIRLHPNLETIVSGGQDSKAITDVSLHPTGDHFLCTSDDSYWSLTDLNTGSPLIKIKSGDDDVSLRCGQFHPDGLIFGTGARSSIVKIWDIKEQSNVAQFPGHSDSVCAISFSENGYYLATGSLDGEVKIWDLRKLKNLKTICPYNAKQAVNALTFDQSGAYLAIGGANVQIFQVKSWNKIYQFDGHTQGVTGINFGENAKFVASSSLDKTVRIFGLS